MKYIIYIISYINYKLLNIKLIKKICIDEDLPVQFVIVPYTEGGSKSYALWHEFDDPKRTIRFVQKIRLCHPPSYPSIDAKGGDENIKRDMAIIYKNIETIKIEN